MHRHVTTLLTPGVGRGALGMCRSPGPQVMSSPPLEPLEEIKKAFEVLSGEPFFDEILIHPGVICFTK